MIKIKRGNDYYQDENPISEEISNDDKLQVVYYHIEDKGKIGVTKNEEDVTLIVYVLEGKLRVNTYEEEYIVNAHDSIHLKNIQNTVLLTSIGASKCLSISNEQIQKVENSKYFIDKIKAVEKKDIYTLGHSRRVSHYAVSIAMELDASFDIITLGSAAILHDIGKINVPQEILQKPARLSEEEYEIIKKHPQDGYDILKQNNEKVATIIKQHHEKLDGSGYPKGLKAEAICLEAKIIAIADVFDALTNKRVYNNAMSMNDAIAYLEANSQWYDLSLISILKAKVNNNTLISEDIQEYFE